MFNMWKTSEVEHQAAIANFLRKKYKLGPLPEFFPKDPAATMPESVASHVAESVHAAAVTEGAKRDVYAVPREWKLEDSYKLGDTAFQIAKIAYATCKDVGNIPADLELTERYIRAVLGVETVKDGRFATTQFEKKDGGYVTGRELIQNARKATLATLASTGAMKG